MRPYRPCERATSHPDGRPGVRMGDWAGAAAIRHSAFESAVGDTGSCSATVSPTALGPDISPAASAPLRRRCCRTCGLRGRRPPPPGTGLVVSPAPRPRPAGARRGCGKIGCLLARRPRHGHVLPAVQESADLVLAVATVATRGADRRQLAAPRPPGDGLRVDPKHRGNLGRGQKTILRLDLGSHDGWSSRAWG